MKRRVVFAILWAATLAVSFAPAAEAQGSYRWFEIYGGYYDPGLDVLDNDITLGLRYGRRFNPNFGWELTGGFFDLNGDADRPLAGTAGDASAYFGEASAVWFIAGSNFALLGGVGFATVDVDIVGSTEDASDDAFTYHFGTFYEWDIGDKFFLKPQVRVRKFEGDTYEKSDTEYVLGLGWKI
jgi:hypothetical protein